jgi:hypothetical protein
MASPDCQNASTAPSTLLRGRRVVISECLVRVNHWQRLLPMIAHMSAVREPETPSQVIEPEVVAFMRRWGVSADDARGMIELEKAGIRWATPTVDDDFGTDE